MDLKEIIKKGEKVYFSHYRAGYMYYSIVVDNNKYQFPVPIDDIGDATFLNEDKAIIFMRYIRKSLNEKTFVTC